MYYVLLSVSTFSCLLTFIVPNSFKILLITLALGCILLAIFLLPTVWVTKQDEVVNKDVPSYPERKIPLRDSKGKFIKRK